MKKKEDTIIIGIPKLFIEFMTYGTTILVISPILTIIDTAVDLI
jgi:hypothetical protein